MRKPIKRQRVIGAAWAIETGERKREYAGYIGKFYFSDLRTGRCIPLHTAGCTQALFATRADARTALSGMKRKGEYQAFPKARAVRVSVTVTTIGRA